MKISVIIPVYNEGKYIDKCLSSVISQSKKPNEILVADDGSSDDTREIVSKYPVKLFKRKHLGIVKQSNFLAIRSKGDILVRLDGDLYFEKNYLQRIVAPIESGKAIATFTKEEYVANQGNIWSRCWSIVSGLSPKNRIPVDMPNRAWTFRAIIKKEFLKVGGYSDLGYGEDKSVLVKLGKRAIAARGAISYHYNPTTLTEVFFSSRFIGRGEIYRNKRIYGLLIHSPCNSLRTGLIGAIKYKIPRYIFFKSVFDLGITIGIIERTVLGKKWK